MNRRYRYRQVGDIKNLLMSPTIFSEDNVPDGTICFILTRLNSKDLLAKEKPDYVTWKSDVNLYSQKVNTKMLYTYVPIDKKDDFKKWLKDCRVDCIISEIWTKEKDNNGKEKLVCTEVNETIENNDRSAYQRPYGDQ